MKVEPDYCIMFSTRKGHNCPYLLVCGQSRNANLFQLGQYARLGQSKAYLSVNCCIWLASVTMAFCYLAGKKNRGSFSPS
jgi:hypothetical protein